MSGYCNRLLVDPMQLILVMAGTSLVGRNESALGINMGSMRRLRQTRTALKFAATRSLKGYVLLNVMFISNDFNYLMFVFQFYFVC